MEYINQVLDKLGIYDLFAVLLSGVIAVCTTLIVDPIFFQWNLSYYIHPDNLIIFFVSCYLVGMILQEVGSLCYRNKLGATNRILNGLLDESHCGNHYEAYALSKNEIFRIKEAAREHLNEEELDDSTLLYNYCRYQGEKNANADKDHSVAAMSRSLSLYFGALGISVTILAFTKDNFGFIVYGILFILTAVLLWNRCNRFYKIRYARIFRTYYYSHLKDKSKT